MPGGRLVPGVMVGNAGAMRGPDAFPESTSGLAVTPEGQIVYGEAVATTVSRHEHAQNVASASWAIGHNLGVYPTITILVGGVEVFAHITHISVNSALIEFDSALTGQAICIG